MGQDLAGCRRCTLRPCPSRQEQGVPPVIRNRLLGIAIASIALVSLPGASLAQEEVGLEGTDWTLISYYDEEDLSLIHI